MVTVQSILNYIRDQFRAAQLDTPELDARLLVQGALGVSHENLLLNSSRSISAPEKKLLETMVQRRLQHEPVSRILGMRAFWKSDFKISPATLDPRADSETLIEAVLNNVNKESPLTIIDMGTGTGCLLLSLLQELPQATGDGIDISPEAIEIARQNAESLNLNSRSSFMATSWNKINAVKLYEVVISNPPYISQSEMAGLGPEVGKYDPITALFGGVDGLDCYREIAALMPRLLAPAGMLFLEIGATQAEAVKGILGKSGLVVLQTLSDLAGHDRCLVARWIKT